MQNIWYLIPRNGYGSLLVEHIAPHLDRAGVSFHAESLARAIIEADGKEFVPLTPGECMEQAVRWGLFEQGCRWDTPLSKKDAAILAVRLMELLERR